MYSEALDFEIDKLTNSIENAITGEVFDTLITPLNTKDTKLIQKNNWLFDWKKEILSPHNQLFKLTTVNNPSVIHGLVSIEDKADHIFMNLLESAAFNRGQNKLYLGIPGNLVAFACKLSFEKGYEGFVAFDAKTTLIEHYQNTLGATHFRGTRMFIPTDAAQKLVYQYFNPSRK